MWSNRVVRHSEPRSGLRLYFRGCIVLSLFQTTAGICWWIFFNNTLIYGGAPNGATTMTDCQRSCQSTATCKGIDWSRTNPSGAQCFLHTTKAGKNFAYNVSHCDLEHCAGCTWNRTDNTNIFGGTMNRATTIAECQNACLSSAGCQSVDWSSVSRTGEQCYLLQTQTGKNSASGVTHYDLFCNSSGTMCSLVLFNNTNILGGTANGESSLTGCQNACRSSITTCRGIDWSPSNQPGQQCFFHTTHSGKQNASGVQHYDLHGTCAGECVWKSSPNTNIPGGSGNGAMTLEACQNSCSPAVGCQSIDWANNNPAGQQCYLLTTQTGKNPSSGVTHCDLLCATGGCTWRSIMNSQIPGGTANGATTVEECQSTCTSTAGCQSIDWSDNNPSGQQCYLLRTQSGRSTAPGVTHYDLEC